MKAQQVIGIFVLLLTLSVIGAYYLFTGKAGGSGELLLIKGYCGGEKMQMIRNPEVSKILKKRYGIELDVSKRGSVEMVTTEPLEGIDFVWPGSQSQLALWKASGKRYEKAEILFNSPIVLYSWDIVSKGLEGQGVVEAKAGDTDYANMSLLLEKLEAKEKWKNLGVEALSGPVRVVFTNPNKSNSGNQFMGLLATVANGEEALTGQPSEKIRATMKEIVAGLGYMHSSSGDLFSQYLSQGVGAYPMVAGYESQIIEFSRKNPEMLKNILAKLRIIYPRPTVWSSHPMIALTDHGEKLLEALQDPEIQQIAWREHGFRPGNAAVGITIENAPIPGIPTSINSIVPMPALDAMQVLMEDVE